ncbi:hypothetical protein QCA50_006524 [Cerrena zonata]|uniref:RNA-binding protein vts1-like alpha-helical domain-containing protein n=1 Tax=Cerrena zonata TaxID=2478898 RepID=A0AAW0GFE7_9APHY
MSSLHAPPSPSPSPGPAGNANGRSPNFRASMGPGSARPPSGINQGLSPASPRPGAISGSGRPTSELLGSAGMFQTPEAEAIDQWFENLQNYEATLEEMAAASLDVNFKEELSAIEQWFKVLSEAERTAALYSLLQHSTQQMARADPMTALLSPAVGGSMQSQMEAKLASMSLKSPGLKPTLPGSPTARNFSSGRASMGLDGMGAYLSPDSANNLSAASSGGDPAITLAQQRAKLKATNAAHRISAPALASQVAEARNTWGTGSSQLGQVDESSAAQEILVPSPSATSSRPKSTDFTGAANAFKRNGSVEPDALSPMVGGSWASNVNTPLIPMFDKNSQNQSLDAAAAKLNDWSLTGGGVPLISDPPKRANRLSKGNLSVNNQDDQQSLNNSNNNNGNHHNQHQQHQQQRNTSGGFRNVSGGGGQAGTVQGARRSHNHQAGSVTTMVVPTSTVLVWVVSTVSEWACLVAGSTWPHSLAWLPSVRSTICSIWATWRRWVLLPTSSSLCRWLLRQVSSANLVSAHSG